MVAQFPAESSNASAIDSFLIPKLDIFVNITDVGTSSALPLEPGQLVGDSIFRSSRVIELRISAKGIQIALIEPAIRRIFTYAINAANNDMNITPADKADLPLKPYAQPTDNPRTSIKIDVDRSKRDKTVDLELVILNLKADCITQSFERVSTYIKEAVTTDLNPSI